MQKVLLISGKKQSGKSSLRNYIVGKTLVDSGVWPTFNLSTKGELMVPTGKEYLEVLSLDSHTTSYYDYASQNIWPYVKNYSFARALKTMAIDMFGVYPEQCFGTNEDKDTHTNIKWADIAFSLPPRFVGSLKEKGLYNEYMTGREFLENLGGIMRKIHPDCWVNQCISDITIEEYPHIVIDDLRFPNELKKFEDHDNFNVISLRLKRNPYPTDVESETAFDNLDHLFDIVIDNTDMSLIEKCEAASKQIAKRWNG